MSKYLLITISALVIFLLPLFHLHYFEWHDQQRIGQIFVYAAVFAWTLINGAFVRIYLVVRSFFLPVVVISFGLVSSGQSGYPEMGMIESFLLLASFCFSFVIYCLCCSFGLSANFLFGLMVRIVCAGLIINFYASYLAAWINPDLVFHPYNLITGFSNIRFQGQFFTLAVPVLLFTLPYVPQKYAQRMRVLDCFIALSCIIMVVVAGTRGSLIGWLFACVVGAWLGGQSRAFAVRFFWLCIAGYALAWLMQNALYWANPSNGSALFRMASANALGLSGREIIWSLAWQQFLLHPWLGIGPMHFAALGSPVAAHPHQIVLQLLSEWGLPVTALIMWNVFRWFFQSGKKLKYSNQPQDPFVGVYLFFALTASMMQAMVDGVLVMPYTQLWLFLLAGWAVAVFSDHSSLPRTQSATSVQRAISLAFVLVYAASIVVLVGVVYTDWVFLHSETYIQSACNLPRFWVNGCLPIAR
jgi:putative inorganic carbon (hco3(-)) transporter